jgi:hypothetical protein
MIAEEYLGRSRLFRRLKSGCHGQLVELYAALLVKDELAGHGTWRCLNLVDDLFSWIKRCELKLTDLDERVAERYLKYRAGKQCIQPGDRAALKRLLSVLREAGMIAPAPLPPITPEDQIFEGFSDYLRRDPLRPKHVWSIRTRLLLEGRIRDLALFNVGATSSTLTATTGTPPLLSVWWMIDVRPTMPRTVTGG